jgi:hypothetical protein
MHYKLYHTQYVYLTHADDLLCLQLHTVGSRFWFPLSSCLNLTHPVDVLTPYKTSNNAVDHWNVKCPVLKPRWNWKVLGSGEITVVLGMSV